MDELTFSRSVDCAIEETSLRLCWGIGNNALVVDGTVGSKKVSFFCLHC